MKNGTWNVSRRDFVRTTLGAAVAAACAPVVLGAEDKSGAKSLVIGKDEHTYEVIDQWPKLPAGKKFGNTHSACETADGRILIHNVSVDSVCEFDPDGKFIRSWGEQYKQGAHGMQLRKEAGEEFLYFATTNQHFVAKTTLDGKQLFKLEYPKDAMNAQGKPCYDGPGKYNPTNIAFHPTDGSFYVADGYGSNYVHHYDKDGKYIRTWGGTGSNPGEFKCPHGIFCDTRDANNPMIVVADRANVRLQYFTLDGKYISTVTHELRHPCRFDQRGGELLIPDLHGRLTIFDKDNNLVTHLGDSPDPATWNNRYPDEKREPGKFYEPHDAIWDRAGNIYVTEYLYDGRVTKLRRV